MSGRIKREPVDETGTDHCADVIDDMDTELGRWLHRNGGRLAQRARQSRGDWRGEQPADLWRCLITIWCTSPDARQRYAAECRRGLLTAAATMDDETFGSLIRGLLLEVEEPHTAEAA